MSVLRLHKFMAECGVASRRKCEEIIQQGRVKVNGKTVTVMGSKIDDQNDDVTCDGRKLVSARKKYYIVNKPVGFLTTNADPGGRKIVFDLIPTDERLFAVGRLDRETEGLIVLTNDGEFANRVAHPRNEVRKTYEVVTLEKPSAEQTGLLSRGMVIDGYKTRKAKVNFLGQRGSRYCTRISIREGRNRQIRKMFEYAGLTVTALKRTAIGSFRAGRLKPGDYRELTEHELELITGGKGEK